MSDQSEHPPGVAEATEVYWRQQGHRSEYTDRLDALWSDRLDDANRQINELRELNAEALHQLAVAAQRLIDLDTDNAALREALAVICDICPVDLEACWCWRRPIDPSDHMHHQACQRIRALMGIAT